MCVFLKTERLLLRCLAADDVVNLLALDSDPDVLRWTNPGGVCAPREEYETRILPNFLSYYARYAGYGFWAAVEQSSHDFLGWFHFRPAPDASGDIELGYRLLPAGRGKGYATEISLALIRKGFEELGTVRVTANTLADNRASRRVMEKAGLKFETSFLYPGLNLKGVRYALDRDDWRKGQRTG